MTIVTPPTLSGFNTFVRTKMVIGTDVLPANSDDISTAYQLAVEITNILMNCVSPVIYTVMVYNLGGHILIETATDVQPPVVYKDDLPYFEYLRKSFGLTSFVGGTIQSTSDESTSESLNVPENLTKLTLADLSYLKTPWGRVYAQYAESYGTIVGLT